MKLHLILLFLLTTSLLPAQEKTPSPAKEPAKWETEIGAIERLLQVSPYAPGGIVFTGSSSIRLWDLKKYFPDSVLANCGFGGSMIGDSTHFAPRLLFPLKPRLIVFYAGDNDSASGHSAARIADDFQTFAKTIHTTLPDCRILYIPIKPSIAREKLLPLQREANALISKQCTAQPTRLQYLDLATPLLGKDGTLRPELYEKDGLHLSPAGYEIWSDLLRPILADAKERRPVKVRSWLPQKNRPVKPPATPR